jgi:tetratricopeptide (TPR) repeat protein
MLALALQAPRSGLGRVGMGRVALARGAPDAALRDAADALAADPGGWLALLLRAAADERAGRTDLAVDEWRTVLARDRANPEAHAGLGRAALGAKDTVRARDHAEAALAAAPSYVPALLLYGDVSVADGDPRAAARAYERAARERPGDPDLAVLHARALDQALDRPGALVAWQAAVALRPDAARLAGLAAAAGAAGDAAVEAAALERLAALGPAAGWWARLGELRRASGDAAGAEEAFRRALLLDPRDGAAWLGLGRVLVARGATREALAALRAAGAPGDRDRAALEERLHVRRVTAPTVAALERAVLALVASTLADRRAAAPALGGALALRVTVDATGAATEVEVLSDTVRDEDVRASAYWNLKDATYPKAAARHVVQLALPPPR